MPAINTVAKVEIYNMERQNVRIEELENNHIITLDELERAGYENIVRHEPPNGEEIMQEIYDEIEARHNAIYEAMDNGTFSDIKDAFIEFYDYLELTSPPFHTITEGNTTVAYGQNGQYKIYIKIFNNWGQFRISTMDGIFERSRLELFNNRVISIFCGDLPQPTIFKSIYWNDGRITTTTEPLYAEIPGFPNYKINKLEPHNVKQNNTTIEPLPPTTRCKYYRYKLTNNKFIYRHKLIAWINHVPGWQRLNFSMTRAEYDKKIRQGRLFVIDHIDNNTTNNGIYNLRIINQRQNLRRRYQ